MAQQHPNIPRYIRAIRAFNGGDLAATMELFRKDTVHRIAGRSPVDDEYGGFDEFWS